MRGNILQNLSSFQLAFLVHLSVLSLYILPDLVYIYTVGTVALFLGKQDPLSSLSQLNPRAIHHSICQSLIYSTWIISPL